MHDNVEEHGRVVRGVLVGILEVIRIRSGCSPAVKLRLVSTRFGTLQSTSIAAVILLQAVFFVLTVGVVFLQ